MKDSEAKPLQGCIFDIKRYAIHDGPGIRMNVFFKGCPLLCHWCHNPEGQDPDPVIMFNPSRCLHCGACEDRTNPKPARQELWKRADASWRLMKF